MFDKSLTIVKQPSGVANVEMVIYQQNTPLYRFTFEGDFEEAALWATAIGYQDIHIIEENEQHAPAPP